jgi:hypothetical protein
MEAGISASFTISSIVYCVAIVMESSLAATSTSLINCGGESVQELGCEEMLSSSGLDLT